MGFLQDIRQLADNISYGWTINVPRRGETMKANIIVNKLDVRPIQRQTQDIAKWRNALIYAESPTQQRGLIYDLYADTLLDTHLEAIIEKRIAAITNCKLTFTIDGKPVDHVVNLTRKRFFKTFLKEAMNAKMYGHTLLQLDWAKDPKTKSHTHLIPRRHVKPRFGIVTVNDYDTEGVNYLDKPFNDGSVIEIGDKESLGKLLLVAPLVIYKRGNWGDWAEFVECFGMPIIDAAYNNEQSREALQEAFNAMGSRGRLIRPEEAKVEIHTVNDNGTGGNLYNTFRQAINEEMSISILGNSMTTTEAKNSGYAQSKTHGQSQEQLHQDDREFILAILQEDLTPYLQKIGLNTEGGIWAFVDAESITLTERLDIDMKVSTKVPIPVKYWYEKYNIPTPQNGEDVTDGEDDSPPTPEGGDETASKGGNGKPPLGVGGLKKKARQVAKLVQRAAQYLELRNLYDGPATVCNCADCKGERFHVNLSDDGFDPSFKAIPKDVIDDYVKRIKQSKDTYLHEGLFNEYFKRLKNSAEIGWGKKFSEADSPEEYAKFLQYEKNLAQFATHKIHALNRQVLAKYTTGMSDEDFRREIGGLMGQFNGNWLKTEMQAAAASMDSASKFGYFIDAIDVYPNLRYEAVDDGRTRETHRALDGTIRPVRDAFWQTHTPPLGWNCRCNLIQTDEDPTPEADTPSIEIAKGFNHNPFESNEIFDASHPYFNNVNKGVTVELNNQLADIDIFETYEGLKTHPSQRVKEIPENIDMGLKLVKKGEDIKILPETFGEKQKNPDLTINGILADFKKPTTANAVNERIKKASGQGCAIAVLFVDLTQLDKKDIADGIRKALQNTERNRAIREVWVYDQNDILIKIKREDVVNGSYKKQLGVDD